MHGVCGVWPILKLRIRCDVLSLLLFCQSDMCHYGRHALDDNQSDLNKNTAAFKKKVRLITGPRILVYFVDEGN